MGAKKVYKYRPIVEDEIIVERDLKCLETNCLFAPSIDLLNDPCETLVYTDNFSTGSIFFQKIMGINNGSFDSVKHRLDKLIEKRNEIGIYSLTTSYQHELLWAHYSNSHYGYCIEYDLDLLLKNNIDDQIFHFLVEYSKTPPQIEVTDMHLMDRVLQKMTAFKSNPWAYENEYRIIFERSGLRHYTINAVTGVYFGLRMKEKYKQNLMDRLKGRGITFFQMKQVEKSYLFDRSPLNDPRSEEKTYLKMIPSEITGSIPVKFEIIENKYNWYKRKGKLEVVLDSVIDENSLRWIAELFKNHLFRTADLVFMGYYVKGLERSSGYWGTSHYQNKIIKTSINSFI